MLIVKITCTLSGKQYNKKEISIIIQNTERRKQAK